MTESIANIKFHFEEKFGTADFFIFSPGRINLIGEHIDYNNGFVMPGAINKGIWYAISKSKDENIKVFAADQDENLEVNISGIRKENGWKNYLLGVVDQMQKRNLPVKGFNAVFGGNLPVGAGMSSSAAVECGLAYALNHLFELKLEKKDLAILCQEAEHTFPGVKTGIMDQFANLFGKKGQVILLDCDSLDYKYLPFDTENYGIVLINSKVHHDLASGEYNKRRSECEEGLQTIKAKYPEVETFRNVTSKQLKEQKTILGETIYKRCLYVVEEIERTKKASAYLQSGDMVAFGKLMYQTHEGLKNLYEVSCKELDFLVDEAKKFKAVIGSRLMGGGFGGCTIHLIERAHLHKVLPELLNRYEQKFAVKTESYEVDLCDGTSII